MNFHLFIVVKKKREGKREKEKEKRGKKLVAMRRDVQDKDIAGKEGK